MLIPTEKSGLNDLIVYDKKTNKMQLRVPPERMAFQINMGFTAGEIVYMFNEMPRKQFLETLLARFLAGYHLMWAELESFQGMDVSRILEQIDKLNGAPTYLRSIDEIMKLKE